MWRAWQRLNRDRPWYGGGMGPAVPGSIAWSSVRDWCEFHDLPGDAVAFYDVCFAAMDVVHAEHLAARQTPTGKQ